MSVEFNQKQYDSEVAARGDTVLQAIVDRGNVNIWNAHAFFEKDAVDHDLLSESLRDYLGISKFATSNSSAAGPFHVLPAALLYCRWADLLSDESRNAIRRFFLNATIDRGNTENHWLMHYTGNLLMAERLEDEPLMWNGLSPAAVRAEATRWITGMIDRSVMNGHHEYDSTGYIAEHVTPLIGLAAYAADASLRSKAEKMLALHFTDLALGYFHGAWAGGHSREGYRVNTWTKSGTVRGIHYLYFGDEEFDNQSHMESFVVPNLVTAYRPPAMIVSMAFERDTPFVVKKTKAPRTIYRHVERESGPVRKYTYQSQSFALGTTQINLPGFPAGPIDLTSWDLTWDGPKHQAKIVSNHPFRDPGRFSAFLSMLPHIAGRDVGTGKPYLQWPDRLFGASPFERIMQHKGAAIVLYQIDERDADPCVNLYLPKQLEWVERNGWLFADVVNHEKSQTDGFFVSLYPVGPYRWHEIREAVSSNIMVRDGDLIDGWMLRIEDRCAALVIEATEKTGTSDIAAFVAEKSNTVPDTRHWRSRRKIGFTTDEGDYMEATYDGAHCINGTPVDYDAWPLIDAPWVHGELGTGIVSYEKDEEAFQLDFDVAQPLLPMRVIG